MKRLKKKAWESVTLYHFTSSQIFMKMMAEGQITSGGYNNSTSAGGHVSVYDLATSDSQGNKTMKLDTLSTLIDASAYSNSNQFSKELIDYVEQKKKENPDGWENESIDVSSYNPSHNEIGVYLTDKQIDDNDYAGSSMYNNKDDSLPNFPMILKIEVQSDALSPDYDDLGMMGIDLNSKAKSPLWKQSLDRCRQCVHNGPIDISNVTGVQITGGINDCIPGDKFDDNYDFYKWSANFIQKRMWVSADEMYNQLQKMNTEYQKIGTDNDSLQLDTDTLQLAKVKSRLKRGV